MTLDDIACIAQINQQLEPRLWSEKQLKEAFLADNTLKRSAQPTDRHCSPVGYYIAQPIVDVLELQVMAVNPTRQQQGLGKELMADLINQASLFSYSAIQLEVRASNMAAQALYQQYGFLVVGERKNYYPPQLPHSPTAEDAVLMTRDL